MRRFSKTSWLLAAVLFLHPDVAAVQPRRSVILFIGDGLGASQMALGLQYARLVLESELQMERLMRHGNTGYSLPLPYESLVTDSAAAATQMATGRSVRNETLGLTPDGYPMETILEWAEENELPTGLVSNMRLTHATPAAFAARQVSRYNPEADVFVELLQHDTEVFLGGGARALVPRGRRVAEFFPGMAPELDGASNRSDQRNLVEEAKNRGYTIISNRSDLAGAARTSRKLLGMFSATHLPYVVDRKLEDIQEVPGLAEMTRAALDVLGRSENGFFLMVEGGLIDYAGHDNDAGTMLHEILDFDEAVGEAVRFQEDRPETLLIVTADHGTGGFSFTYGDWGTPDAIELPSGLSYRPEHRYPTKEQLLVLRDQLASYELMLSRAGNDPERLVQVVREHTRLEITLEEAKTALARDADGKAWTVDFRDFYGDTESNPQCLLGRALARHTYVVWSTGGHTMEPVLTFGRGPASEKLRGVYPNTHVHEVMMDALTGR